MSFNSASKELQNILSDNSSGSRELLNKLLVYLRDNKEEINHEFITILQNHFSDFQTIQSFLYELQKSLKEKTVDDFLLAYNQNEIFKIIYENLKPVINGYNSFVTLSNSKTILEVLKIAAKEKEQLQVFVSEGRPICEGKILAENLTKENIKTTLITEAQLYDVVQQCDCGIIGADKILSNGNVVNKVGSNLLALVCKEFNKPLFVIADKSKTSEVNSLDEKEKTRNEIYTGKNERIQIRNYYFEEIPKKYITKIITD